MRSYLQSVRMVGDEVQQAEHNEHQRYSVPTSKALRSPAHRPELAAIALLQRAWRGRGSGLGLDTEVTDAGGYDWPSLVRAKRLTRDASVLGFVTTVRTAVDDTGWI